MNYPTILVAPFTVRSGEAIAHSAAIAIDSEGFAHNLKPGEAFRGLAIEGRDPVRDEQLLYAVVQLEGFVELTVSGFTHAKLGQRVFCTGLHTYTLDSKSGGSAIGHAVAVAPYGKAWVKFKANTL